MEYPKREDEEAVPTEEDRDLKDLGAPSFAARNSASTTTNVNPPQRVGSTTHGDRNVEKHRGPSSDDPMSRWPDHPMGKAPTPKHPDRQSPHRVLGSEARRASWDDLENVVVEVEIIQWPSATQSPRGRVVEILGYEDDFGVDVEMIIRKHHIPHVFPQEVLEEAQEISPEIPPKEIAHRRDFRDLPIVTIDGETARDFDDAVLVTRLENGNYELQVHIADVAHYVEDGSAIDEEARKRGTSVYFPDRAVPMLPLELSTDICSLRPQLDRLVLSCIMEIDRHGEVLYYELAEGVIRSAQRMTYTDVNAIIEAGSVAQRPPAHKDHHGPQPGSKKDDRGPQPPSPAEDKAGAPSFARSLRKGWGEDDRDDEDLSGKDRPPQRVDAKDSHTHVAPPPSAVDASADHTAGTHGVEQAFRPAVKPPLKSALAAAVRDTSGGSDHPITKSPDHPIDDIRQRYGALSENFDLMYELAQILNRKRVKRGSIDFDLPEPIIEFDEHGFMKSVEASERNWAHRLIEEFMLAANETVASHLEQRGVASLYRIHEKPDPKRLYEFETIAASFGYSLGVGALPIKRVQTRGDKRHYHGSGRRAPTIELPEEVHITPRMYQKLVQKITGKPEERVLSFLMLRSLKQARYSEINEGHFALAAPTYTHFTSPIRRYPDLIVHRVLKWLLRNDESSIENVGAPSAGAPSFARSLRKGWDEEGRDHQEHRGKDKPGSDDPMSRWPDEPIANTPRHRAQHSGESHSPWSKRAEKGSSARRRASTPVTAGPYSEAELHEIAESSSQSERTADEAERELLEWKKLKFMEQRVGEDFDSLIVSVTKFGFFVELTELFIEGLVPLNSLTDDHYTYHDNTRQIIGARSRKTYSIGDKVRVLVDRIDHLQRKIQFAVLEEKPTQAQKRHRKRR
jgi:exoribonuclease R